MPILRIQSAFGTARFKFDSLKTSKLADLQKDIHEKWNIAPDQQILSFRPLSSPAFVEAPASTPLADLDLQHGSMLYMALTPDQKNNVAKTVKTNPMLTDAAKSKTMTLTSSEYVNNPPPEDKGPKYIPFHQYIEERQAKFKATPWNIDPPKPNYKPIFFDDSGIVKKKDLPENAHINLQKYRHCDGLEFLDARVFQKFKQSWGQEGGKKQKAAFLIGGYKRMPNPLYKPEAGKPSKQPKEIMRGQVVTMYEPAQTRLPTGVKFLADDFLEPAIQIARAMGHEVIGWMITTQPRGKISKEFPQGDMFLSGGEVIVAARFQHKFRNPNTGYSRFCTMVVYPGMVDPRAFMISDQGTRMINDGLVCEAKEEAANLMVRPAPPKAYFPAVINENKEVKQGENFDPTAMLVDLAVSAAVVENKVFKYLTFPHPRDATDLDLRRHADKYKDQPYHQGLACFYLLCYLTVKVGKENVLKLATHIKNKQRVGVGLQRTLDSVLRRQ